MFAKNARHLIGALILGSIGCLALFSIIYEEAPIFTDPVQFLQGLRADPPSFAYWLKLLAEISWCPVATAYGWYLLKTGQPIRVVGGVCLVLYFSSMWLVFSGIEMIIPYELPPFEWDAILAAYMLWGTPLFLFLEIVLPPWPWKEPATMGSCAG